MIDKLNIIAIRMGYLQMFAFMCFLFMFICIIIIGRYQWAMRKLKKNEYYPAKRYQTKRLDKYIKEWGNIYIRSSQLYDNNEDLSTEIPISKAKLKFITELSKKYNVILLAPDIDDKNVNRSLYKYIQYIKFYKIPITRITNIIPDNIKLKETTYNDSGIETNFTYFIKVEV